MEQQPLFHPNYAQENQFSLKEKKKYNLITHYLNNMPNPCVGFPYLYINLP